MNALRGVGGATALSAAGLASGAGPWPSGASPASACRRFADHPKGGCRIGTGDLFSLVSFCRGELATQGVDRVLSAGKDVSRATVSIAKRDRPCRLVPWGDYFPFP